MPNFKSISRTVNHVKLLVGDKMHIASMVKEFKHTDKRFETETAAIRYYVHVGIAAETATSDLRNSLNNTIVKESQQRATREELKPIANMLDILNNKLDELSKNNEINFADMSRRNQAVEDKLDRGFGKVLELIRATYVTIEFITRNLIILRSVFYVFLLGFKTGKIPSGEENAVLWSRVVKAAHSKASELSVDEVQMLSEDELESQKIQAIASEIFKEATRMPQPVKQS